MKDVINSNTCTSIYPICETPVSYCDETFKDFDAQAERLVGHDQEYIQLSPGEFSGRFASLFLGEHISLHVETCNQSLEQNLTIPDDSITIGLVLNSQQNFLANNSILDESKVMITAPGAELNITSPIDGKILAICVNKHFFMDKCNDPALCEYFDSKTGSVSIIDSPYLAAQLRDNARGLLRELNSPPLTTHPQPDGAKIGTALIETITAQFSLQNAASGLNELPQNGSSQELFHQARKLIADHTNSPLDTNKLSKQLGCSTRTIQKAFACSIQKGPATYDRIVRLNNARKEILSPLLHEESIGDVAFRHGFWNLSRFSSQYRSQFGELPSETRSRVI